MLANRGGIGVESFVLRTGTELRHHETSGERNSELPGRAMKKKIRKSSPGRELPFLLSNFVTKIYLPG